MSWFCPQRSSASRICQVMAGQVTSCSPRRERYDQGTFSCAPYKLFCVDIIEHWSLKESPLTWQEPCSLRQWVMEPLLISRALCLCNLSGVVSVLSTVRVLPDLTVNHWLSLMGMQSLKLPRFARRNYCVCLVDAATGCSCSRNGSPFSASGLED